MVTLNELMENYKTPEIGRRVSMLITASEIFQRPYVGPPGMRRNILRSYVKRQKTLKDSAFLEEVKSKRLDAEYTSGEEMEPWPKR